MASCAGVQLWKILDVALLYDVHIYTPDPAAPSVSDRLELCLYNQVCKKLANLVCNAQNIEQLREICGVTADGFTQEERMQKLEHEMEEKQKESTVPLCPKHLHSVH